MAKCKHMWADLVEKDGTKVKWCMLCGEKK
jgi:hypothetical protein